MFLFSNIPFSLEAYSSSMKPELCHDPLQLEITSVYRNFSRNFSLTSCSLFQKPVDKALFQINEVPEAFWVQLGNICISSISFKWIRICLLLDRNRNRKCDIQDSRTYYMRYLAHQFDVCFQIQGNTLWAQKWMFHRIFLIIIVVIKFSC